MKTVKAKVQADTPITERGVDEAIERGKSRRSSGLQATAVTFLAPYLAITFEDGGGILLPVANYSEFDDFEAKDFAGLTVGFDGTALCHEEKDLDVSLAGMISASQSLMAMAASVIASRNGRQISSAKSEAARANGRKGGRPRKADVVL
ncbi:DUF2442 domain-containing protein [Pseudomonas umsongensis]|jgi:hypothetical protein|uniref:DUF2442 domain-containing protein n=1 Tax=Pseudomonas umsongensis TaxID=198618 RepID=A0AAE7A0R2_9PSED|nr:MULTISPECIES: DUF2442 domain-containing protein [Pseudomonas]KEX94126.1 hypothetical protein HA62_09340 [Pseudomonas putida]EPA95671.1 Protein of unknown function (DUF3532) [Pseudomonas sp. G5(2012)]MBT9570737.1 DUF2442 domain-containing protein [Pseudomonas umsongensis]OXR29112.1 hypothetical protein PSUM_24990 [Pseudomonas umsongensis]QFG32466.1 DUF2442 domain-containing protein [Pseudomonas umsongensis]